MKISELARRGGIPIHTLKYYIREGLLPAGRTTAVNQADYGDFHLRRLRFIRALTGAGGLSIPATREILAAIDSPPTDPGDLLQVVGRSLGSTRRPWPADESRRFAVDQVDALLHRRAWRRPSTVDALDDLIDVVAGFYAVGVDPQPTLNVYADAVTVLARHDLADLRPAGEQPAERAFGHVDGDRARRPPARRRTVARHAVDQCLFAQQPLSRHDTPPRFDSA